MAVPLHRAGLLIPKAGRCDPYRINAWYFQLSWSHTYQLVSRNDEKNSFLRRILQCSMAYRNTYIPRTHQQPPDMDRVGTIATSCWGNCPTENCRDRYKKRSWELNRVSPELLSSELFLKCHSHQCKPYPQADAYPHRDNAVTPHPSMLQPKDLEDNGAFH